LLVAIEKETEARKMGISLTPEEQFEIFGTDRVNELSEEARERWGDTDTYRESQRRTGAYAKEDWIRIKAEADRNIQDFAAAMRAGELASGQRAMALAEEHRQHISRWFYECGYPQHRGLAELYVSDPRFTAPYDDIGPGFSQYVHDAILANAERAEAASS
jgi:hypothetical protein